MVNSVYWCVIYSSLSSETTIFPMDTEPEVAMLSPTVGLEEEVIKIALDHRVVRTHEFWRAECMMKFCVMLRKCLLTVQSVALLGQRSWMRQLKIFRPCLLV